MAREKTTAEYRELIVKIRIDHNAEIAKHDNRYTSLYDSYQSDVKKYSEKQTALMAEVESLKALISRIKPINVSK